MKFARRSSSTGGNAGKQWRWCSAASFSMCRDSFAGCVFLFQAEDGIRDLTVTGVQTCALPIWIATAPGKPRSLAVLMPNQKARTEGMLFPPVRSGIPPVPQLERKPACEAPRVITRARIAPRHGKPGEVKREIESANQRSTLGHGPPQHLLHEVA